ncbi:protocatechuate 3,4-dioxygenase alpha subunit [Massilia sp. UYP11]|uniref:protocatechuate 3,4-dioxygenase n=1 Tax=Massilia sp. UYP11 TaxID=1756385 RepID=UPI003D21547E
MSKITTSQTIGPFSHEAWQWAVDASLPDAVPAAGATVLVSGVIYDGDGAPVNDAQIEVWTPQGADAEPGRLIPGFRRAPSGEQGEFSMRVAAPAGGGEPLMYVTVFARGLVKHQFTAVFLEDDAALAQSAILNQVPQARRATLLARKMEDGRGEPSYRWDIHLQGEQETVFFDYV